MQKRIDIYKNKVLLAGILQVTATILCFQNLVFYLDPNISLFVFLALTPFVLTIQKEHRRIRFAWLSVLCIVLYFFLKMQLLYFLSFASLILFIIESNLGKVNALPLFIILLISPYSSFIFNVFGFPTRLLLTDIAGYALSFVYDGASSSGNNILLNGQSFSVDPECMGLKMVGYGFATTLVFIGFAEKNYQVKLKLPILLAILSISAVFIVLSNLFRILAIVIVQAKPETISHELIGLLCFGFYCILPVYFVCKGIAKRSPAAEKAVILQRTPNKIYSIPLTILLVAALSYFNFNRGNYRNIQVDLKSSEVVLDGFEKTITKHKVVQFQNANSLIYIKPACHFFAPDHSPTICWRGSGYEFKNINTTQIGNYDIYTAELHKEKEVLYTAWWFDNGQEKTISQLDWRWKTALGAEPFRLINLTAISKEDLDLQVKDVIGMDLF